MVLVVGGQACWEHLFEVEDVANVRVLLIVATWTQNHWYVGHGHADVLVAAHVQLNRRPGDQVCVELTSAWVVGEVMACAQRPVHEAAHVFDWIPLSFSAGSLGKQHTPGDVPCFFTGKDELDLLRSLQLGRGVVCGVALLHSKLAVHFAHNELLGALHAAVAAQGDRTPGLVTLHEEAQLHEVARGAIVHEDIRCQLLAEWPIGLLERLVIAACGIRQPKRQE
mmetsp:Transcript_133795/g.317075  ORF Transcript_133795/g.317075 Transcript_133795/m.317075 type:complete len:224 (-) Transcript_133795:69-740(-)